MEVVFVLVMAVCVIAQDGTVGSIPPTRASTFLVPSQDVINSFTLGARRHRDPGLGRDFAYNCTNGVRDWEQMGFMKCVLGPQSPINIAPELMPGEDKTRNAANRLYVDYNRAMFVAGNEFILNLTSTQPHQQQQQQQQSNNQNHHNRTMQIQGDTKSSLRSNAVLWSETGREFDGDRLRYELERIEFHSPAEHLVNGVRFALEIQLHHINEHGERLSIAVFGRETTRNFVSQELLSFTSDLFPTIPETSHTHIDMDPSAFLPRLEGLWSYNGSLTSPPCASTRWAVMHYPVNVTKELIDGVRVMVGLRYFGGNARDVQKKENGFKVTPYPRDIGSGELLFVNPASLSNHQINVSSHLTRIQFDSETSVIELARQASLMRSGQRFYYVDGGDDEGFDDWSMILNGRPKSMTQDRVQWNGPSSSLDITIHHEEYKLVESCPREYLWTHRFISPFSEIASCIGRNSTKNRDCMNKSNSDSEFPQVAPGQHLVQSLGRPGDRNVFSVSAPEIRKEVESEVRQTDPEVVRVVPDDVWRMINQ